MTNPSPVTSSAAHPMARSGYGKRSAPGQRPRTAHDFEHLHWRDAAIAGHIDRLPEGADISIKGLAGQLTFGQMAVSTSLRRLSEAGHLRRVSERDNGATQWVTRTYFSRTARDDAWWETFLGGGQRPKDEKPVRSRAYTALARLGEADPRMLLSARDCAELEKLAAPWFERGVTEQQFWHALTAGLPREVFSARGIAHRRLTEKLPPDPVRPPAEPSVQRILECTVCNAPGRPAALPGGLCRPCRGEPALPPEQPRVNVSSHAARIRAVLHAGRGRRPAVV
ncbi:hypothetical protein [Streptomyces sp. NPDC127098]|uniref:hypothetical protein n=1 Tax=Streptomyces sp. NPDC127098 TaxID=3347137 RepID=UPI003646E974